MAAICWLPPGDTSDHGGPTPIFRYKVPPRAAPTTRHRSGGKLFPEAQQRVISKAQKYAIASSSSTSRTCENTVLDAPEIQMADLEHGKNFQLVDWEENDLEV
ncbi:hypothetical protein V500_10476 [Pseudogymnoascus sp. VKM F-4518 (FW-2643)]|nr:hypothetical protein V500_10476 [Pseudogymnoascus sp. VKM F-4518 (FW-2643)]